MTTVLIGHLYDRRNGQLLHDYVFFGGMLCGTLVIGVHPRDGEEERTHFSVPGWELYIMRLPGYLPE